MSKKNLIKTGYPHIDRPWMKWYEGMDIPEKLPQVNMVEFLKAVNEKNRNKIASIYYGREKTYDQMFHNADIASRVLSHLGVKKGDTIMYLVPNVPEEEELWFGATQIGAISDFIDPRPDSMNIQANAKKVFEIIKYERPKYIIALDKCYLEMLKPIEFELKEFGINDILLLNASDSMDLNAQLEYLKDVINYDRLKQGKGIIEEFGDFENIKSFGIVTQTMISMQKEKEALATAISTSPLNVLYYKELAKGCKNSQLEVVNDVELINYIGHTSGTSGSRPKPITFANKNAISSMIQCKLAGVGPQENNTSLHLLPGFAPFGRYNNGVQTYANSGINIHIPEFAFSEFGYLLKRYKPNTIMVPPAFLLTLFECRYLDNEDLSYLNKVIYGGDAMAVEDEEKLNIWLRKHGCTVEVEKGHGMSEFCGCGSYARNGYNKPDSIGIPIPKTIYAIIDPDVEDKLVPLKFKEGMDKLSGELIVSSEHVTDGILHGNVIVPHYEMDGNDYIRTRDLVEMDRDGVFYINARKDRSFARIDGYKIKPYEIEKVIEQNPKIHYAKVVDYYDEKIRGIMPICHMVLENEITSKDGKRQIFLRIS